MPHREPALLQSPAPASPRPLPRRREPDTWQRIREEVARCIEAPTFDPSRGEREPT
jgi:hypothetical protein